MNSVCKPDQEETDSNTVPDCDSVDVSAPSVEIRNVGTSDSVKTRSGRIPT